MSYCATPPKFATLLLRLFSGEPDFPEIEGDLNEEFHNQLVASGPNVAHRSYRREALRNVWALAKRPRAIRVLGVTLSSVFVFPLTVPPFFEWLDTFSLVSRAPAFQVILLALFEITVAVLLGALTSRLVRGAERVLRAAFTGFYLLFNISIYLLTSEPAVIEARLLYFSLNVVNWSLILAAFWIASIRISQAGLRHRTRQASR
jgi:hypothetical protein